MKNDLYEIQGSSLIYSFNSETIRIENWGKNAFRVRAVMMNDFIDEEYAILPQPYTEMKVKETENSVCIQNGKITARLEFENNGKCRMGFFNHKGDVLLQESLTGGALNKSSRYFRPVLGGDFSLTASFLSDPDEKLYGMGQYQQEILNIKNCTLELAHRNSQSSVPFVMSSKGYGFMWHNPAIGRVTFAKNETIWYAENTKQLDYWITAGDTPDEIECNYADVTGKAPMMPEYGMGFWQCKLRYWSQEQLLEVAREYHRRNVPVSVIVIDFFHWPKMGDFRFEEEFFPNPKGMVEELKSYGMELMISVWPQVALDSENYQEMKRKGYLVKTERGVEIAMRFGGESTFFDATNPEARKYVWNKCKENYYDHGIKIFWLDEAEPEYTVYDFDNYRYKMGTNLRVGNIYPQLFSRTFYEGQTACGQNNIINLVRCAWLGSQRYGALVWSGDIHSDWQTLRKQLCAGLNMGLAGIPWWTTDIGGFAGGNPEDGEFRELVIRWFEWGTFCPVMRLHGDRECEDRRVFKKDGTQALFTGGDNEIWSFGTENTAIFEKYINIREEMRPYIRRLMEDAHELGRPVMRTMFYEFPDDKKCWELQDQYMFGDSLLVAPILYPGTYERTVYLPGGTDWKEACTNQIYDGGQVVNVMAAIDQIPLFIKIH